MLDELVRQGLEFEAAHQLDEAKHSFRLALRQEPTNADALAGLGRVLYRQGARGVALRLFERLVANHPADPAGNTNLGILLLEADEFQRAEAYLRRALELDSRQTLAHYGLSRIAAIAGDDALALAHQRAALGDNVTTSQTTATTRAAKLLVLASHDQLGAVGAQWLADPTLSITTLIVERAAGAALPEHHAIFNTITDADRNAAALAAAALLIVPSPAPVVNPPHAVLATARTSLRDRLAGIPGVRLPLVAEFAREHLESNGAASDLENAGFRWPLLLRAKGFHSGQHFLKVEKAEDLPDAAGSLPGAELLAIEYLDTQSADRGFRKYRVMIVDGTLYPLHLAVADEWKVHYFSAAMAEHEDRRAEDAAFLANMEATLGPRAVAALRAIAERLELDYAGIDFALDPDGNVVVFEANATMTVPAPLRDPRWDYRRSHVTRILDATRRMLLSRARAGGWL